MPKVLWIALALTMAAPALAATCESKVKKTARALVKRKGGSLDQIQKLDRLGVVETMNDSAELDDGKRDEVLGFAQKSGYEFYLVSSSKPTGGSQDIYVVKKDLCKTVKRFNTYDR